jgi:hypothetical protein
MFLETFPVDKVKSGKYPGTGGLSENAMFKN